MCVPSLGWTLNEPSVCQHNLGELSPAKSRRTITGTLVKLQIPAQTTVGKATANQRVVTCQATALAILDLPSGKTPEHE